MHTYMPVTGSNINYVYGHEIEIIDPTRFDLSMKDATSEQIESWIRPAYMFLVMSYAGFSKDRQFTISSNCSEVGLLKMTFYTLEELNMAKALLDLGVKSASITSEHSQGMIRHSCDVKFDDDVIIRVSNPDYTKFCQMLKETVADQWTRLKGESNEWKISG